MKLFQVALTVLLLSVGTAPAALWRSEDFGCSIDLPDGNSVVSQTDWTTIGSTDEGTLVGAQRLDQSAFIFLGYVEIAKRPKFHLNEKTIQELEKRYFGPGQGFRRGIQRVSLHGLWGYRLTGDSVYKGSHYGLVVDMYEANGRIYQLAGMRQNDLEPLKDTGIRSAFASFKIFSE